MSGDGPLLVKVLLVAALTVMLIASLPSCRTVREGVPGTVYPDGTVLIPIPDWAEGGIMDLDDPSH